MKHNFGISVEVDNESGAPLSAYFKVRDGKSVETREYGDGIALADYDRRGQLLGIEVLGPCLVTVIDKITKNEPEAKRFVKNSAPRKLVVV